MKQERHAAGKPQDMLWHFVHLFPCLPCLNLVSKIHQVDCIDAYHCDTTADQQPILLPLLLPVRALIPP